MAELEESSKTFDPFAEPASKPRRGGTAMAFLALLIALAVAGWNGWQWWQSHQADSQTTVMRSALDDLARTQAEMNATLRQQSSRLDSVERLELESGLAQLDDALTEARSVAGSDRARLQSMDEAMVEVRNSLERLESRVAAIVVRGESPRQGLELAEVDYLLRSATERLSLYGDVRSADQALALADAQLESMDDPVYLGVRQSIATARLALDDVDRPDPVALTAGLSSLQARIPGLPFPGEVSMETPEGPTVAEEDQTIWQRFTGAVSGLVSVRRNEEDLLLISLEDKDTVRQALWLQLESARLALLREDDGAYQSALERAEATLKQYFETDSDAVTRFSQTLTTLGESSLEVSWPDISEPWTRLKSIRDTQAVPAAVGAAQVETEPQAETPPAADLRSEEPAPVAAEEDPVEPPAGDPDTGPGQ